MRGRLRECKMKALSFGVWGFALLWHVFNRRRRSGHRASVCREDIRELQLNVRGRPTMPPQEYGLRG